VLFLTNEKGFDLKRSTGTKHCNKINWYFVKPKGISARFLHNWKTFSGYKQLSIRILHKSLCQGHIFSHEKLIVALSSKEG